MKDLALQGWDMGRAVTRRFFLVRGVWTSAPASAGTLFFPRAIRPEKRKIFRPARACHIEKTSHYVYSNKKWPYSRFYCCNHVWVERTTNSGG